MAQETALQVIELQQLPIIVERLHSVKAEIERRTAEATSLICTEETYKSVKDARAQLTKEFKEYEAQRTAIKSKILEPYNAFEQVYRECVTEPFKRADADLKGKIDATEREIKGRCEKQLEAYFQELCAVNHVDFLTFAQTGVRVDMASARAKTPKKLMDQLRMMVEGCAQAMATIDGMAHGDEIAVEYKKCLDLTLAIRLVTERHQKLEAERQRAAEEAKEVQFRTRRVDIENISSAEAEMEAAYREQFPDFQRVDAGFA